jgi:hypothetical protein
MVCATPSSLHRFRPAPGRKRYGVLPSIVGVHHRRRRDVMSRVPIPLCNRHVVVYQLINEPLVQHNVGWGFHEATDPHECRLVRRHNVRSGHQVQVDLGIVTRNRDTYKEPRASPTLHAIFSDVR